MFVLFPGIPVAVAGAFLAVLLLLAVIYCCRRRRQQLAGELPAKVTLPAKSPKGPVAAYTNDLYALPFTGKLEPPVYTGLPPPAYSDKGADDDKTYDSISVASSAYVGNQFYGMAEKKEITI